MKRLILAAVLALLASPALASNCNPFPYTLTNGTTADASQVMSDFNNLLSCANSNLAHNGVNSDINTLSGLTTPLTTAQGGTGNGSGNIPGTAATATALVNPRTIGMTGDVVWTSASFNGSANVTGTSTIQPLAVITGDIANGAVTSTQIATGGVALTNLATQAAGTIVGNNTGGSASPIALTAAQARVAILPTIAAAGQAVVVNAGATDYALGGYTVSANAYATVSGGTATIQKGHGVSAITRTGSSTWTVVLTSTLADTNGTLLVTAGGTSNTGCAEDSSFARTTNSFGITCFNGGGAHDPTTINVSIMD